MKMLYYIELYYQEEYAQEALSWQQVREEIVLPQRKKRQLQIEIQAGAGSHRRKKEVQQAGRRSLWMLRSAMRFC